MNYSDRAMEVVRTLRRRGVLPSYGNNATRLAYWRALAQLRRHHSIHRVQVNRDRNWNEWTDIGGEG